MTQSITDAQLHEQKSQQKYEAQTSFPVLKHLSKLRTLRSLRLSLCDSFDDGVRGVTVAIGRRQPRTAFEVIMNSAVRLADGNA